MKAILMFMAWSLAMGCSGASPRPRAVISPESEQGRLRAPCSA
jgi:hypothetical protein